MVRLQNVLFVIVSVFLLGTASVPVQAQVFEPAGTALVSTFTYQGYLEQSGVPVTATCDFLFSLFDAPTAGTQIGNVLTRTSTPVTDGIFNVQLNFGLTAFSGDDRYLAISVRCPAGSGSYTDLTPRQAVTPAPYATYATRAAWSGLQGVPAGFADGIDNDLISTLSCTNGQVAQYNGTAWVCAIINGSGDITAVTAGNGLTGGGQSGAVTLDVDPTIFQYRIAEACAAGASIRMINEDGSVVCETDDNAGSNFWSLTGNAGTNPTTQFIGTTDNIALNIRVNNARALRIEPGGGSYPEAHNVIAGSRFNTVWLNVFGGTISGGGSTNLENNEVIADFGTISGGYNNTAGYTATVGGGGFNQATATSAVISGGSSNTASGDYSTVSGGGGNTATQNYATVMGGYSNAATGEAATVAGGYDNTASGTYSFAAGRRANAQDNGAFVWADGQDVALNSPNANTFSVRANGGIWLGSFGTPSIPDGRFINTSTGGFLSTGGAWTNASDVNAKENFADLDPQAVLETLMAIPVTTWNYIAEGDAVRRMGPMAQDFYAAYGLGDNDTTISTIDAQGVAFAAIQGLYQTSREENTALEARIDALETENADLQARVERLEAVVMGGASAGISPLVFVLLAIGGGVAGMVIRRKG